MGPLLPPLHLPSSQQQPLLVVQTLHSPSSQQHHSTSGADLSSSQQQPLLVVQTLHSPSSQQQPLLVVQNLSSSQQQPLLVVQTLHSPSSQQQPLLVVQTLHSPSSQQQPLLVVQTLHSPSSQQQPLLVMQTRRTVLGSENERPESGDDTTCTSDSDSEFDSQTVFDDWVVSLSLLDRKMLAVLLTETLQKRFNIKSTAAALEAAWVTGFNEKRSITTVKSLCKTRASSERSSVGSIKDLPF